MRRAPLRASVQRAPSLLLCPPLGGAGVNLRARSCSLCMKDCGGVYGARSTRGASECVEACEHRRYGMQGVRRVSAGRRRSQCKQCGLKSASTVVYALTRMSGGSQSASTVVYALSARNAVTHKSARARARSRCTERRGALSASTVVSALGARSAVEVKSASTVVSAYCKECGGSQICEHGRQRSDCKTTAVGLEFAASSGRRPNSARSAVGLEVCELVRVVRSWCTECPAAKGRTG